MSAPPGNTHAPEALDNSQAPSTGARLRPLPVETLIREARAAGYDGPQRKLVRYVRRYVDARADCSFATWLKRDPTAKAAMRNIMRGGGHHAAT